MEGWPTRIIFVGVSAETKASVTELAVESILHEHSITASIINPEDVVSAEVISSSYHHNIVTQDEHSYTKELPKAAEIVIPKGRPKKGRKRKHEEQTRHDRKKLKNSNIEHYNTKNVKVSSKPFLDFDCGCSMACATKLSAEVRRREYENFWQLGDYTAQNAYIASLVHEYPVKRKYGKNRPGKRTSKASKSKNKASESENNIAETVLSAGENAETTTDENKSENKMKEKQFSRKYHLKSTEVCRSMFCKTLNISSARVNTALKKMHGRAPLLDLRGLKTGGQNKLAPERTRAAVEQMRNITTYVNNCYKDLPQSRYLPPEMTLEKMYKAYKAVNDNPISLCSYKKLFYQNFNLKFKAKFKEEVREEDHRVPRITEDILRIMSKPVEKNETEAVAMEDTGGRPKKGRKRIHPEQSRSDRKKLKNKNIEHYNSKNVKIEAKAFIDFDCRCSLECALKLRAEDRRKEYERFWQLGDYTTQNAYIAALVSEYPVKRKTTKKVCAEDETTSSMEGARNAKDKQFSRKYGMKGVQVCRLIFCKTFNISPSRVNTALKKMHGRAPLLDLRGVKQGGSNKLPERRTKEALTHIENVLRSCNLSCEKHRRQYLPAEMNVMKMHRLYKEASAEPISFSSYKRIFYENFNFKCKPKRKKEVPE